MGTELNGKTLGIIGLGRIGREVALRMQSFGMTTIGFDPIIGADVAAEFNTEWMPLEQLWPRVDFITVHTPLIPATTNLINDAVFSKCKRGVRVVNCARGGIIDEAALLRALESGQCGGAGLDVFVEEPPKDLTLVQHPKVTATPHLGASTVEAQSRVAVEIAEQFVDLAQGKQLFGAINAPALTNALSPQTQPWVKLGESLGVVASLLTQGPAASIQLVSVGAELEKAGSYLSAAVLAGYLRSSKAGGDAGVSLNLVNAPVLAKQAGLQVTTSSLPGPLPGVSVTLSTSTGQTVQLAGTVAGGNPVLTSVQGSQFTVPASLSGPVLVFSASPSPNLLPSVIDAVGKSGGSVLGLSLSNPVNSTVYGVLNLSALLSNGLEALKKTVSTVNQTAL
nr:hypothetical protein BaRGS_004425 [Batillaria attramentaria]